MDHSTEREYLRALRLLVFVLLATRTLHAQRTDLLVSQLLAPGVEYQQLHDGRGPWAIHLVRLDLRRAAISLVPTRAHDQLRSRERTSDMVRRRNSEGATVLAAVNADFFDLKTGENENNQVINGEWWKGLKVTDSPYDTYDNVHVQFALDGANLPEIDRFALDANVWAHGVRTPIISVNFNPTGNPEGSALFTSRYGNATPRDTARVTAEATLIAVGQHGDTLLYVRRGDTSNESGTHIPSNGAVFSAYGARAKAVQAMHDGDTVRVLLATLPRLAQGATPRLLIGGWPRILRDGVNIAGDAATVEGTISRNAEVRHARTSIGFSRDRRTVFILTVDGRSEKSVGMTLIELAAFMRSVGAWQAMNFDGGGSTTMVIHGSVVNAPSDPTGEREVGNALLVITKPISRIPKSR